MDIISTPEKIMKDALRRQLLGLLEECTVTQRKQFVNVFKFTAEELPTAHVIHAISLSQSTVRKNRENIEAQLTPTSRKPTSRVV